MAVNQTDKPRFFYPASRAHHAYGMAVDYGMEFERRFGKWEPEALLHILGAKDYRICVHADSLHMLEPRVGDVIYTRIGCGQISVEEMLSDERAALATYIIQRGGKIIQRGGVPFHWPDIEP